MNTQAKSVLSSKIHLLRDHLLQQLTEKCFFVYRMHVDNIEEAELSEDTRKQRVLLEYCITKQRNCSATEEHFKSKTDILMEILKEVTFIHINRHIYLRLLEGFGIRKKFLIGGLSSPTFQNFNANETRSFDDDIQRYVFLLDLIFDDLAKEFPWLFRRNLIEELIPLSNLNVQKLVEELDILDLESCWTDDMTMGWVYQFWNQPDKLKIDTKVRDGHAVENHEISSKTQLFTERYLVDWILQNTLGSKWLAICAKNNWIANVVSTKTFEQLKQKKEQWKKKREDGSIRPTDLMPTDTYLQKRWIYYVEQPISKEEIHDVPSSIRDIKILDPSCGSGHFLVIAMGYLFDLYKEESRHRNEHEQQQWSDKEIVESILSQNIYGLDIDSRVVQVAATTLLLKAKILSREAQPTKINLVSSELKLRYLRDDHPTLVRFIIDVERETGIKEDLTRNMLDLLKRTDDLGTLLKIHGQIDTIIARHCHIGKKTDLKLKSSDSFEPQRKQKKSDARKTKIKFARLLYNFLKTHTRNDDLGVSLSEHQQCAGIRYLEINKENYYDLVVGNPPYLGQAFILNKTYIETEYDCAKFDLYACFMVRGLMLVKKGGFSALLTQRGWMFTNIYEPFRNYLLQNQLKCLADLNSGAFSFCKGGIVITNTISIFQNDIERYDSIFILPKPLEDITNNEQNGKGIIDRNMAGLQVPYKIYKKPCHSFQTIKTTPFLYWWSEDTIRIYNDSILMEDVSEVKVGMQTGNNLRFVRFSWEVHKRDIFISKNFKTTKDRHLYNWIPYIKGAKDKIWIEPLQNIIFSKYNHLNIALTSGSRMQNSAFYYQQGIAYKTLGFHFRSRIHFYQSITDVSGASVYPKKTSVMDLCVSLNSSLPVQIAKDFNPTQNFQTGDIKRIPFVKNNNSTTIMSKITSSFLIHESHRESSVEFKQLGESTWRYTQDWAQTAINTPADTPLPQYNPIYDSVPSTAHISYALGIVLGRFLSDGSGILDPEADDLSNSLPFGILFLNGFLPDVEVDGDSLSHPAASILHQYWKTYGSQIPNRKNTNLRDYLREDFFADVHLDMYEKRPIYWPLSSQNRIFVAWINIHRMDSFTLGHLEKEYLQPAKNAIQKNINTFFKRRAHKQNASKAEIEVAYSKAKEQLVEIQDFIDKVHECATKGPPPIDDFCIPREKDNIYDPKLDDGVMINAAALWPLLDPQWKTGFQTPKNWWKQISQAQGKMNDWSHLAMKYWPTRVQQKCQQDPSLAVDHGCLWKYHPTIAWEKEIQYQHRIDCSFTIQEEDHHIYRHQYLICNTDAAIEVIFREVLLRAKEEPEENEIVLNCEVLWAIAENQMRNLEDSIAEKLYELRMKRNTDKELKKEPFTIKILDRDESILDTTTKKQPK